MVKLEDVAEIDAEVELDVVVKLAPVLLESFGAVDVVAVVLPAKTSFGITVVTNEPNIKNEKFFKVCFSRLVIFLK